MAKATQLEQLPCVSPTHARGIARASLDDACALLLADAIATGEGVRILGIAATRKGKSTFARRLLDHMLKNGVCERAIVHDAKFPDRAQYAGCEVWTEPSAEELAAMQAAGLDGSFENARIVRDAFLANERTIVRTSSASAAALCGAVTQEAVLSGIKTCLVFDEGAFALARNEQGEPIERQWAGPELGWLQLQGGAAGGSSITLWQMPRMAPSSCLDSLSAAYVGQLGGRSLAYAKDYRILPPDAIPVVTTLPPGAICIFFNDREWDRTIYYSPERE